MKQDNRPYKKITRSLDIVIFFFDVIGMWYTNTKKEKLLSDIKLTIAILNMTFACIMILNGFFYSLNDLQLLSYAAPLLSVVVKEILKLFVLTWNRKKVMDLNRYADVHFWKKDYNYRETQIFNEYENKCFTSLISYTVMCTAVAVHLMASPMYENLKVENVTERELPFPIYQDRLPLWQSPYYEITYVIEVCEITFGGICATIFVSFFYVSNMFTAMQFKFLNTNLEELCSDIEANRDDIKFQEECSEKLKIYIKKHQLLVNYTNDIEDLYSYVMLVQIFGSVTQICFCGFQVLLATIRPNIPFHRFVLSTEFCLASVLQFYMYCYCAHEIFLESERISESMYLSEWFKVNDPKVHKHFTLLIQIIVHRARKPCILTVGKFCPLNLDTFSSVMRSSMSYFTVLRQTLE